MMAASSNGVYFSQAGPCFQLALLECHKGGPAPLIISPKLLSLIVQLAQT